MAGRHRLIILGLACLWTAQVSAAEPDRLTAQEEATLAKLIRTAPPDWRWAGPSDLTTTSRCYRNPRTPFCGIDGIFVCLARRQKGFCSDALLSRWAQSLIKDPVPFYRYRLLTMRVIHQAKDAVVPDGEHFDHWRSGDIIFGVEETENPCNLHHSPPFCFHYAGHGPTTYLFLRKTNGIWHYTWEIERGGGGVRWLLVPWKL